MYKKLILLISIVFLAGCFESPKMNTDTANSIQTSYEAIIDDLSESDRAKFNTALAELVDFMHEYKDGDEKRKQRVRNLEGAMQKHLSDILQQIAPRIHQKSADEILEMAREENIHYYEYMTSSFQERLDFLKNEIEKAKAVEKESSSILNDANAKLEEYEKLDIEEKESIPRKIADFLTLFKVDDLKFYVDKDDQFKSIYSFKFHNNSTHAISNAEFEIIDSDKVIIEVREYFEPPLLPNEQREISDTLAGWNLKSLSQEYFENSNIRVDIIELEDTIDNSSLIPRFKGHGSEMNSLKYTINFHSGDLRRAIDNIAKFQHEADWIEQSMIQFRQTLDDLK